VSGAFRIDSVTDRAMQVATVCQCRVDRWIAEEVVYGHGNQLPTVHPLRPRAVPNDGNRYELLDGVLIVTPAPSNGWIGSRRHASNTVRRT